MQTTPKKADGIAVEDKGTGTIRVHGLEKRFKEIDLTVSQAARFSNMPGRTVQKIYEGAPVRRASVERLFEALMECGIEVDNGHAILKRALPVLDDAQPEGANITPIRGDGFELPVANEVLRLGGEAEKFADQLRKFARRINREPSQLAGISIGILLQCRDEINLFSDALTKVHKLHNPEDS